MVLRRLRPEQTCSDRSSEQQDKLFCCYCGAFCLLLDVGGESSSQSQSQSCWWQWQPVAVALVGVASVVVLAGAVDVVVVVEELRESSESCKPSSSCMRDPSQQADSS